MKAPTLFLFFFATLSSLAFAQPLQRRNFDDFYGCLLQLSLKIGVFNHYVSTNSVLLEVGGLLGVLEPILGGYEECNSALSENGPLSQSEAQKSITEYGSSSSAFSNGLNQVAENAPRNRNGPGIISADLSAFGGNLQGQVNLFANNLNQQSPQNGANQKQVGGITNGLDNSIKNAFGN
ncbi:hypothetical protein AX14_014272 [Amanita brunnescens Koide BX004]|nr:hypothetical protein AX14_014272 [Amanita brunnescens Koide BX004]